MGEARRSLSLSTGRRQWKALSIQQPNLHEGVTLPFVIPTRISCHTALDKATCAPFCKEERMNCDYTTKYHRKSGGAKPRDLRFYGPVLEMFFNLGFTPTPTLFNIYNRAPLV
jgi:hypothetical protein